MPKVEWSESMRRQHSAACKEAKRLVLEQKMRIIRALNSRRPPTQVWLACS